MRRVGIFEERGSGFDNVVSLTESYQLPAPAIELKDEYIKYSRLNMASLKL